VRAQIEKVNEQYKTKANKTQTYLEIKLGDLVWLHLRTERFPLRRKNKLIARGDGPYKIVHKVGDNAYKVELLGDMNISTTFNVGHLTPYIEDEDEDIEDLRENPLQGVEVDTKKTMKPNLLINIKAWVQLGPLVIYVGGT